MAIASSTKTVTDLYKQAQSHVPMTVSIPKSWIRSYEDFVQKNASQVFQIESALRSLTYILPGLYAPYALMKGFTLTAIKAASMNPNLHPNHVRLLSREGISSQAVTQTDHLFCIVHTTINLLSTYHTSLLPSPSHPSPHTRYTTHHRVRSRLYARSSTLLRTIQYTELLCEMFFKRRGGDALRWRLVVFLEIIKAVCRALMLRVTGWRMGISPAVPDQRASEEEAGASEEPGIEELLDGGPSEKPWKMSRTQHTFSPLPERGTSITGYLSTRIVSPDSIKHASLLVRSLSSYQSQAAEMLYILRPVIYALAMLRFQGNKRDWRPWALSLAMEVAARQLAKKDLREQPGGMGAMTSVEKEEWSKRGWSVAWWGMRGAFYENFTRVWIQAFADRLKGKPLLDMVGGVVEDYEYLWDEYYFSTATM